ncbi:hypothetical protein QF035_005201 [Streptomyces umbrinus]|uniref:Uncharacterized protein n=1 Tax=Streptomyces umbrinus TaxID=67370 RepID=A0ABU0SVN6_9ACTN|nr:hypothetical protein [Streptomyces umbrinus]
MFGAHFRARVSRMVGTLARRENNRAHRTGSASQGSETLHTECACSGEESQVGKATLPEKDHKEQCTGKWLSRVVGGSILGTALRWALEAAREHDGA